MFTAEESKALVRRYYDVINSGDFNGLDEIVSSRYQHHVPGLLPGVQAFKQVLSMYRHGFPDLVNTIEDLIVEGDKIVARVGIQGSHQGIFLGHPPTQKPFKAVGIDIFHIAGGKIAERWGLFDTMAMLQQLGLYTPTV
jgi:predicted ester cyclase